MSPAPKASNATMILAFVATLHEGTILKPSGLTRAIVKACRACGASGGRARGRAMGGRATGGREAPRMEWAIGAAGAAAVSH